MISIKRIVFASVFAAAAVLGATLGADNASACVGLECGKAPSYTAFPSIDDYGNVLGYTCEPLSCSTNGSSTGYCCRVRAWNVE